MTAQTQTAETAEAKINPFRKWGVLAVLSLALAIVVIDTSLLNVSFGVIIRELHTTIQSLQWVITAYALTLTALTITGGRLGDIFGRRRMFMLGAIIFAIGSFTASISHSVPTLLIGEAIIEGVGAALMLPATASLLVSTYRGRDRAIAFGFWGGVAGAASAVGPILGGWLTSTYSWRWGFRINVFVAAILLIGTMVLIREVRDTEERPTIDWGGVVLSSLGLLSLVFGIIESSSYGWWKANAGFKLLGHTYSFWGYSVTPITIAIGVVLLAFFLFWEQIVERSDRTPLVSLKLFMNRQFSSGVATLAVVSLGLTGLIFILPIFFQGVRRLDAFHTGISLLPLSISLFVASPVSVVLTKWLTPKRIIQIGLLLIIMANYTLFQSLGVAATAKDLAVGLALFGAGMGFVQSQIANLTLSAVSVQQAGEAAGVNNTGRQLGSSLGSAIIGAIMLTRLLTGINNGISKSTILPANIKQPVTAAAHAQLSAVEFGSGLHLDASTPLYVEEEVRSISDQATADAGREAMLYGLGFALLSLLISISLPNIQNVDTGQSAASKAGH